MVRRKCPVSTSYKAEREPAVHGCEPLCVREAQPHSSRLLFKENTFSLLTLHLSADPTYWGSIRGDPTLIKSRKASRPKLRVSKEAVSAESLGSSRCRGMGPRRNCDGSHWDRDLTASLCGLPEGGICKATAPPLSIGATQDREVTRCRHTKPRLGWMRRKGT